MTMTERSKGRAAILAAAALAAATYVATMIGALDQVRAFLGWQSTAEGIRQATEAIADLETEGASPARQKWAADRLVLIASTHSRLRLLLARRLADFVRARCALESRDGLARMIDALDVAGYRRLYEKARGDSNTDDVPRYVLQCLGAKPFLGLAYVGDEKLDLRGIVVPEWLSRERVYENVDFSGALFPCSSLMRTRFRDCNLTGVRFTGSRMDSAIFERGTSARNAKFVRANLPGAQFIDAHLKRADFTGANLIRARWRALRDVGENDWADACVKDAEGPDTLVATALKRGAVTDCKATSDPCILRTSVREK